jgi:competence ComEA-like helix-hairpin-helix protein
MREGGSNWVRRHFCLLTTALILCLGISLFLCRMLLRQGGSAPELRTERTVIAERKPVDASGGRVDLNTASAAELAALPGLGRTLAERIVEYRRTNGRFRFPYEIMNIPGIDEKTYEALRDRLAAD